MESRLASEQVVWEVADLLAHVPRDAATLVATPSVAARVSAVLPYRRKELSEVRPGLDWLVVAGGGRLLDAAKLWRATESPATRLAAVPTLWGSGAEASPIAVTFGAAKDIRISAGLLPDARVRWPALADGLPPDLARWASGDALTHATEALLSPLGDDALRTQLGTVLSRMVDGVEGAAAWFEISAEACWLQSRASVGLVHGIAHVLEPSLWAAGRRELAAHARLCAAWLAPVLRFNLAASPKAGERLARYGVSTASLLAVAERYGSAHDARDTAEDVRRLWPAIVRDRCTRTNVALVRPGDVEALLRALS